MRKTLLSSVALAAAVVSAAPAAAQDLSLQIPISFGSHLTALGDTLPFVAERIEAISGGSIAIEIAEPGTVVRGTEIFDAVSSGSVDVGYSWMGYEIGQLPSSALFGATPFGLEPADYIAWYYFGYDDGEGNRVESGQELVAEIFEPYNVYPIFCGTIPPEAAGWFTFPIENLEQIQGLRFRAAGLGGRIMESMGASVTVLPGSELYQALETGVLDATEFSLPTVDRQLGFYQIAQYYHLPGWHQPSTSQYLYWNLDAWNELDEVQQEMFETACMAGVTYAMSRGEALQGPVLNQFIEDGVNAVRLPEDVLRQLYDQAQIVLDGEAENSEDFARVLNSMRTYMQQAHAWRTLGYLPRDFYDQYFEE